MKITRDVVTDLWPLYVAKEASADSHALIDEFLAQDPEFARLIRANGMAEMLAPAKLDVKPDAEMKIFLAARRSLLFRQLNLPLFLAMLFSCFAFGRIVSDTSFDVSPRNFIVVASIAAVCWITFFVQLILRLKRMTR